MLALTILALHEWAGLVGIVAKSSYILLATVLGCVTMVFMHQIGFHAFLPVAIQLLIAPLAFWVLVVPLWLAKGWRFRNPIGLGALGLFLLGALWLAMVSAQRFNPWVLLVIISTIWIADSAAYFVGKQFGRHKLAPGISPGKTWEGVFGALLGVTVFAILLWAFQIVSSLLIIPGLCALALLGVIGDLFESLLKRQANLKDSGTLLPGHGGMLDRIDGVIPAMPAGIVLLFWHQSLLVAFQ